VYPQIGHVAIRVIGSTSRKLVQPLVLQYGRPAACERRRRRRIAADRPVTAVVVVLVIMVLGSWVPSGSRVSRAPILGNAEGARRGAAALTVRSYGSGEGAGAGGFLCPGRRGSGLGSTGGRRCGHMNHDM
jgi:hypothetical protein